MQQVVLPIKDSNILRSCLRNQLTSKELSTKLSYWFLMKSIKMVGK